MSADSVPVVRGDAPARIAATLQHRIETGEYTRKVPSRAEIAAEFGVSLATAQRALGRLSGRGIIAASHGSGHYVRGPLPAAQQAAEIASGTQTILTPDEEAEIVRLYRDEHLSISEVVSKTGSNRSQVHRTLVRLQVPRRPPGRPPGRPAGQERAETAT